MNASPISLPSIADLHENLLGLWLNSTIQTEGLTFKQFGQCKKMYIVENKNLKEPLVLHALGYIAPLPFQLSSDNGYHPNKPLPPWCKDALKAIFKIPAWCWLEKISEFVQLTTILITSLPTCLFWNLWRLHRPLNPSGKL